MKKEFITLNCLNKTDRDIAAYPITFGVPLKAGEVREGNALAIRSANGKSLPLQTRPLQYHADGSVAWMLLDFTASFAKNESVALSLVEGKGVATRGLTVSDTAKGVVVTSSHYKVRISREEFSLFDSWLVAGKEQIAPGSDVVIEDTNGKRFYGSNGEFTVKVCEVGSIRVEVEVEGRHTAGDGAELLSYRLRYTFRRDDPCIKLSYAFTNREMPEQGIKASQIRLIMPTKVGRGSEHLLRQSNTGLEWFSELRRVKENVEILATKAMHEAAKTRYGNAAEGKVVVRNLDNFNEKPGEYPYYLRPGNIRADYNGGLRSCYPYIGINGTGSSLLAWFSEMDVNFPKGVAADRGVLTFDIWPAWAGDVQVRRGQTKEHDIFIGCFGEPNTHEMLEGVYFDHEFLGMGVNGNAAVPIEVKFDAAYIRETEVFDMHRFLPFDEARYVRIEEKLNSYTGNAAGSRGMFDYGDSVTPDRSSAHNNENDAILWGIREYYRRRNWNLLVGALAKARHNAHVDFIAFDPDPLREGTMPAHCPEHTDGAAYPSHMWTGGLLAAYLLTGNEDFRSTAISVGENMIRWMRQRPSIFYADSRECGWPMLGWLQLYDHTLDKRWLKAAREVADYFIKAIDENAEIKFSLPHGVGTFRQGYGEFIAWRALYYYYERTGARDVKKLLAEALPKVYQLTPARYAAGGWACNDLYPAWAAYQVTGEKRYLEDNYKFLRYMMQQAGGFRWGGVDMHYYLAELDKLGELQQFC